MPKTIAAQLGNVTISEEVLATLSGVAAVECAGLAGMASRRQMKDSISEWLGRDNPGRGVEVRVSGDVIDVDLHIIVTYGMNIYDVAHSVRDRVRFLLTEQVGIEPRYVNIYVQGVRIPTEVREVADVASV